MENIFTDALGKFGNRTRTLAEIDADYQRLYPRTGEIIAHEITAEILKLAVGSEYEFFNSHEYHERVILLNNLIIDAEITDTAHLLRILQFDDSDFVYIHHLIGSGFHEILNQI